MNITLEDIKRYIFDNYGRTPILKEEEWTKDTLYYPVKDGEIEVSVMRYYGTNKQFISCGLTRKNYSGWSRPCDSYEELNENLIGYMEKQSIQLTLF